MELRTIEIDGKTGTSLVHATHPDHELMAALDPKTTARIVAAGQPFWLFLQQQGLLPQGQAVDGFWLNAETKTIHVETGGRRFSVDYEIAQYRLRELARTARREVLQKTSEPGDLPGDHDARWDHLYRHGGDGWELGKPSPPLVRYFSAHPPTAGSRVLVVGCGRGHEALLLASLRSDVQVVGVDLSPTAIALATESARAAGLSDRVHLLTQDLFAFSGFLPGQKPSRPEQGLYDWVVEHNCFCAIDPARRDEYVAAVARLLRPSGQLVGLFYVHDYPGGPPYGATADEICARIAPAFTVTYKEVPNDSPITRAGLELLLCATRL